MDYLIIFLSISSVLASCGAAGGVVAHLKKRPPSEGLILGLFLGPVGVAVEARRPAISRPEVCERAWSSFRSVATYQPTSARGARVGPRG